jgi:hypothetical protein
MERGRRIRSTGKTAEEHAEASWDMQKDLSGMS